MARESRDAVEARGVVCAPQNIILIIIARNRYDT
jgi:hypothetical protein